MYTVKENIEKTIIINKSKFISKAYFVTDISEANYILNEIKNEYNDATHVCFGYIINNNIKYSDDGEPNNTAGLPLYNAISKNHLSCELVEVFRYFGGIKLGAGVLVRVYSKCASNLIDDSRKSLLLEGYECNISFKYDEISTIDNLVNSTKCKVIEKKFEEMVQYNLIISNGDIDKFNKYNLEKIKNTYLEI